MNDKIVITRPFHIHLNMLYYDQVQQCILNEE